MSYLHRGNGYEPTGEINSEPAPAQVHPAEPGEPRWGELPQVEILPQDVQGLPDVDATVSVVVNVRELYAALGNGGPLPVRVGMTNLPPELAPDMLQYGLLALDNMGLRPGCPHTAPEFDGEPDVQG